jgi:hypothetical protein
MANSIDESAAASEAPDEAVTEELPDERTLHQWAQEGALDAIFGIVNDQANQSQADTALKWLLVAQDYGHPAQRLQHRAIRPLSIPRSTQ